jgi:formamidopyrimidine-DNA glycosylase
MVANIGDVFKPGDKVQRSGIYRVTHDGEHREAHEVTCVYGKKFPPCNHCGNHPRFKLVYGAKHIEQDDDFK